MKPIRNAGAWVVAGSIGITLVTYANWQTIVDWCTRYKDIAGWAQVLGAALAIFGAVAVTRLADVLEREAEEKKEAKRLAEARRLACVLADVAKVRLAATIAALNSKDEVKVAGWTLTQRTVEADLSVMRALNLHDLGDREPMQTFALLLGLMRSVCDYLEPLAKGSLGGGPNYRSYVSEMRSAVMTIYETASGLAAKLHDELGHPNS